MSARSAGDRPQSSMLCGSSSDGPTVGDQSSSCGTASDPRYQTALDLVLLVLALRSDSQRTCRKRQGGRRRLDRPHSAPSAMRGAGSRSDGPTGLNKSPDESGKVRKSRKGVRICSLTLAAGDAGAAVALSLAVAIPRVAVPCPPVRAPLQLRRQELIVVMNRAQRRVVGIVAARACRVRAILGPELDEEAGVRWICKRGLYCLHPWQSLY